MAKSLNMKIVLIGIFLLILFFAQPNLLPCFSQDMHCLQGEGKGYNVILIILDALRPDCLSCYGYPKDTSPSIAMLAQDGIVFEQAFSQASYTIPSVVSIFTSLYPHSHNVKDVFKDSLPERIYTIAEVLRIYGYDTVWFGPIQDPHSGSAKGVLHGFTERRIYGYDGYDTVLFGPIQDPHSGSAKGVLQGFTERHQLQRPHESVFNWVREHRKKPFFITIHSYSTHEGFFPFFHFNNKFSQAIPKEFYEFFEQKYFWEQLQHEFNNNPENLFNKFGQEWVKRHKEYFLKPFSPTVISELISVAETPKQIWEILRLAGQCYFPIFKEFDHSQRSHFFALLESAIFEEDKQIGRLIEELKRNSLLHKTIIIITADHGNGFGEHGQISHGEFLYDGLIHVPLIMYLPGISKSVRINDLAQSIDIMPTILELLGCAPPYEAQGISLLGLIGRRCKALENKFVFAESGRFESIRTKDWKFVRDTRDQRGDQLFFIKSDPLEQENLIQKNKDVAESLRNELESWKVRLTVYGDENSEFSPDIDEQTRARIRETGYW